MVCEKHRVKHIKKVVSELERNRAIADKERWSKELYYLALRMKLGKGLDHHPCE